MFKETKVINNCFIQVQKIPSVETCDMQNTKHESPLKLNSTHNVSFLEQNPHACILPSYVQTTIPPVHRQAQLTHALSELLSSWRFSLCIHHTFSPPGASHPALIKFLSSWYFSSCIHQDVSAPSASHSSLIKMSRLLVLLVVHPSNFSAQGVKLATLPVCLVLLVLPSSKFSASSISHPAFIKFLGSQRFSLCTQRNLSSPGTSHHAFVD